ncbi:MAG: hypothetical protein J6A05_02565, partial [Oscillospiraceae bacterium]|nr:hypothetical protein [Oscillospiraceae bacterium]
MKKGIALILSALMILSTFSACSKNKTDTTTASATSITVSEKQDETEQKSETIDFFGEGYDPFDDNYDPYGGNGAVGAEHTPETAVTESTTNNKSEVNTEATTEKKNEETKPSSTEKQTSSDDVSLTLNSANSWDNGTDKFTQIDGIVRNDSDKPIGSWTVTIKAASNVSVDQ